jgi:hypothetical protein
MILRLRASNLFIYALAELFLTRKEVLTMPKEKPSTTPKATTTKPKKGRSAIADVVAREYTIHLHKRVRR